MTKKHYALLFCLLVVCGCSKNIPHIPVEVPLEELVKKDIAFSYNPFLVTPLAASVAIETYEPCAISVSVDAKERANSLPIYHQFDNVNTKFTLPIFGFYPGIENEVEIVIKRQNGDSAIYRKSVLTKPLREEIMDIEVVKYNKAAVNPGLNFAIHSIYETGTSNLKYYPLMWDANGDIRWIFDAFAGSLPTDGGISGFLKNGNAISFYGDEFREYSLIGELKARKSFPGYNYHHDYYELPDGNLLLAVDKKGLATVEDHVIEVDRNSGAVIKEFDLRPILDMTRPPLGGVPANDWFHNNSVYYDQRDGSIILSGQQQGVVKIDRATGALKWIFAPHNNWGTNQRGEDLNKYLLKAVDAAGNPYNDDIQNGISSVEGFDWSWGQHNAQITRKGTMILFDNGFNRNHNYPFSANYSRIVEYEIDEVAKTVKQVWQFGYNKPEYVSFIVSSAAELENGNRMMGSGTSTPSQNWNRGKMIEIKGNEVVFEATYHYKNKGNSGDMVYRTLRKELYHD